MSDNLQRLADFPSDIALTPLSETTFEISFGADSGLDGPMTIFKSDLRTNEKNEVVLIVSDETPIQIVSDIALVDSKSPADGNHVYIFADGVRLISRKALTIVENDN